MRFTTSNFTDLFDLIDAFTTDSGTYYKDRVYSNTESESGKKYRFNVPGYGKEVLNVVLNDYQLSVSPVDSKTILVTFDLSDDRLDLDTIKVKVEKGILSCDVDFKKAKTRKIEIN